MTTEYVPGEGDVEITLEGKTLWLKPSLEACLRISRATGTLGPRDLVDRCLALNFDAVVYVVAAGLEITIEEAQPRVYQTGIMGLFGKCVRFIHIVSNGGRPAPTEDENKPADPTPSA